MNYFALSHLLVSVSSLSAAVVGLLRNPRNKKNITFFIQGFSIACWTGIYAWWQMATNPVDALFRVRLQMMACAFISPTNYHFIIEFFELNSGFRRKFLYFAYALAIFMAVFGFSPYFIPRVEPRLFFPYWPVPGPLIDVLFLTLPIPLAFSVFLIWQQKNKAPPLVQNKLKWVIWAMIIGYGGGCTNCLLWYNIPIPPYLGITTVVYQPVAVLLFFKLGLMDFNLFIRDLSNYFGASLICALAFGGLAAVTLHDPRETFLVAAAAFSSPFLYGLTYKRVRTLIGRTPLGKITQYLQQMDHHIEEIRESTYTYDDLARNVVASMLKAFPVSLVAVYFYDLSRKEFHLRAQKGMKNPLVKDLRFNRSTLALSESDPLISYLTTQPHGVNLDFLQDDPQKAEQNKLLIETFRRMEANVCAPFIFDGKIKGMLVVGQKKDNTLFNKEDMEGIQSFARMGQDLMRYIMGMETELRNTSLYSHDMDNDIRSVIQTLDFATSPMSRSQAPEKVASLLTKAKEVAERIQHIFQMNRDRSALIMKSVRGEYQKVPLDLFKVIRSSTEKFQILADQKKVLLKVAIPEGSANMVGNEDDLIRVIDNLISNALRYVPPKGSISVVAALNNGSVIVKIQDTGVGIPREEIEKIWDMGWQSKDKNRGAAGFGLAIVRQIVQLHEGEINAASEGPGKGTTFTIVFPSDSGPTS